LIRLLVRAGIVLVGNAVGLIVATSAALGGVALIATFVSLVIADVVSDGLDINGVGTWIARP
jgi:hypothetical protein